MVESSGGRCSAIVTSRRPDPHLGGFRYSREKEVAREGAGWGSSHNQTDPGRFLSLRNYPVFPFLASWSANAFMYGSWSSMPMSCCGAMR